MDSKVNAATEYLKVKSFHFPEGWVAACLEFLEEEHRDNLSSFNNNDWSKLIEQQWLYTDIRDFEISSGIRLSNKVDKFSGTAIFQIMESADISRSFYSQLQEKSGPINQNILVCTDTADMFSLSSQATQTKDNNQDKVTRCLMLQLTDGVNSFKAMEFRFWETVPEQHLLPGAKVRLRGVFVLRNNIALLQKENIEFLGGEVEDMKASVDAESILEARLNQNLISVKSKPCQRPVKPEPIAERTIVTPMNAAASIPSETARKSPPKLEMNTPVNDQTKYSIFDQEILTTNDQADLSDDDDFCYLDDEEMDGLQQTVPQPLQQQYERQIQPQQPHIPPKQPQTAQQTVPQPLQQQYERQIQPQQPHIQPKQPQTAQQPLPKPQRQLQSQLIFQKVPKLHQPPQNQQLHQNIQTPELHQQLPNSSAHKPMEKQQTDMAMNDNLFVNLIDDDELIEQGSEMPSIEGDSEPFTYLSSIESDLVRGCGRQVYRVRCVVMRFLGKLTSLPGNSSDGTGKQWLLRVNINDGASSLDCRIADSMVTARIGCTADEIQNIRISGGGSGMTEYRNRVVALQRFLISCNCGIFTLHYLDSASDLVVVDYEPLQQAHLHHLSSRVHSLYR